MNILVANDDGIEAEGIRRLVEALEPLGDVYVFAPDGQRSANSHALSISRPIKVTRTAFSGAKEAYKVDGTPADCVKLGMDMLRRKGKQVDIIYSGINHGGNLGGDTVYSGTVSAAAEGAFAGIPAVAVSVNSHAPVHFEACCKAAAAVFPFAFETAGEGTVINVNAPDIPVEEIQGVRPAMLGVVTYDEWFDVIDEAEDSVTYRYSGTPVFHGDEEDATDTALIKKGFVTISVLKYDLDDEQGLEKIKEWEIDLK